MHQNELPIEVITKITKLTVEEVETILNDN